MGREVGAERWKSSKSLPESSFWGPYLTVGVVQTVMAGTGENGVPATTS